MSDLQTWLVPIASSALSAVGSVLVVVGGWMLNERSRRQEMAYRRRERRYRRLLSSLPAFFVSPAGGRPPLREQTAFLRELRLAWLYCPDAVIRAGNRLQEAMLSGRPDPTEAGRAFVAALRRDLLPGTRLAHEEFMFVSPASPAGPSDARQAADC